VNRDGDTTNAVSPNAVVSFGRTRAHVQPPPPPPGKQVVYERDGGREEETGRRERDLRARVRVGQDVFAFAVGTAAGQPADPRADGGTGGRVPAPA